MAGRSYVVIFVAAWAAFFVMVATFFLHSASQDSDMRGSLSPSGKWMARSYIHDEGGPSFANYVSRNVEIFPVKTGWLFYIPKTLVFESEITNAPAGTDVAKARWRGDNDLEIATNLCSPPCIVTGKGQDTKDLSSCRSICRSVGSVNGINIAVVPLAP